MFSSATKKVALFAAIIGVTGVVAGASAFALHGPSNGNGRGNSYAANQCKNGGWRELGYKNQGQCIADMTRGETGGGNGTPGNGNGNGNSLASIIGQFISQILSSVQSGVSQIFIFIGGFFSFR